MAAPQKNEAQAERECIRQLIDLIGGEVRRDVGRRSSPLRTKERAAGQAQALWSSEALESVRMTRPNCGIRPVRAVFPNEA